MLWIDGIRYADLQCIHCVLTRTCLARHDGRLYWTSKDTDIDIRQHCDCLAKTPRGPVTGTSLQCHLWRILCFLCPVVNGLLSNCLRDGHLLYCFCKSYRLTCCKGQALSRNKSTEMRVMLNAVRVTIAVSLRENAEKLLFPAYNIILIDYRYWLDDKCVNYIKISFFRDIFSLESI